MLLSIVLICLFDFYRKSLAQPDNSFSSDTPYLLPVYNKETHWRPCNPTNQTVYQFQVPTLDGNSTDLNTHRGKVLLVTNTATYSALTEQYVHFNRVLDKVSPQGFSILAFPCNQFFYLEPGMNHEILNGLKHVRPGHGYTPHEELKIFGKVDVNGEKEHPLFTFLKQTCPPTGVRIGLRKELMWDPIKTTDIAWNFEKFLVDRNGIPRYRFYPTSWNSGDFVMPYVQKLLNESSENFDNSTGNKPLKISLRQVDTNPYENKQLMGYSQTYGAQAQGRFQQGQTMPNQSPALQIINVYPPTQNSNRGRNIGPNSQPNFIGQQNQQQTYQNPSTQTQLQPQPCCSIIEQITGSLPTASNSQYQQIYPQGGQNFIPQQNLNPQQQYSTNRSPNQRQFTTPNPFFNQNQNQQQNSNFYTSNQNQLQTSNFYPQNGGQQQNSNVYPQNGAQFNPRDQNWQQNTISGIMNGYRNSSATFISRVIYEVEAFVQNP